MAFGKLKIKAKVTLGRGAIDATVILKALQDHWSELQYAIKDLPEDEQNEFKAHFDQVVEGEDDLGAILFGSWDEFDSRMKFLDEEATQEYTDELLAQEVLDKETLEQSLKEFAQTAN